MDKKQPRKMAIATHGVVLAVMSLLILSIMPATAVEVSQPAQLRVAQATTASPYSKQAAQAQPESLPTPDPQLEATPTAPAGPIQHFIPFAKSDPDADIQVKENQGLISLMVRDASLRQVVAMIAETQKLNIVFAAPADIGITASFDRIPWQQALDSLLTASGHTWTNSNGIIYVCSLETADFMPPGLGGRNTRIFELDFASAIDVDLTIKGLLSPAGQSWVQQSDATDNRRTREVVVVFDSPGHLDRIAQYICEVDQPPRQVLIEAHILQVELDDECKNGVDFEAIASFRGNEISFETFGFANAAASPAFFLDVTGTALNGLVEILQTTTDAKTLASPRLLVVNGQESRIQIGEQLGYRVTTTTQTSSLESVEFLNVGVVLTVTPRITRDGRIMMHVKPEVSTGSVGALTGLPEEETTEVETDILLNDGQGMVIGGLIQEQDDIIVSKIPWLGDLPYVGVLFQKRQAVKGRTEIIVTLTPHVQPYTPMVAEREAHNLMRTEQPLTMGALHRAPRPYEPRMYDALTNPRRPLCTAYHYFHPTAHTETVLPTPLPPVEQIPYCVPTVIDPGVESIVEPVFESIVEPLAEPKVIPGLIALPAVQDENPGTDNAE